MYAISAPGEQRRIAAYLDGLPPIGDAARQAKVNALAPLWFVTEEPSP